MKSRFSVCIFGWVPRAANRVAHLVCRWARDCGCIPFGVLPFSLDKAVLDVDA